METKEEMLAFIKKETNWSDEKCLEWYNQQEEADRSANKVCAVWYAYSYETNGKPKFVVTQKEPTTELMDRLENYECTSSEKRAKELIKEWKEPYEREKEWDKYINR